MKKILITGGAGFIGSNLVKMYIDKGYQVVVVDDLSSGNITTLPPNVTFYEERICHSKFIDIVLKEKPDIINHHAAQIDIQFSIQNPLEDAKINILGTINLLEAVRKLKEEKEVTLVYASSAAVYGNPVYLGVDENHQKHPISFYGISKLTPEYYINVYHQLYEIPFTILRYANVYGIGQDPKGEGGVISILMDKIISNSTFTVFGDGEQTRDYIYVEDIASANFNAGEKPANDVCNVGTNIKTSLNTLLEVTEQILNRKIEVQYQDERSGDIRDSYLTNEKIHSLLNWQPAYTLYEGLEKTLNYYIQQTNRDVD
ncbi:GDP-mannose 4,6-dehydratase [Gottfriedia sp. NPDC057948]|uniref:GDP-mannose 4,6-dehydratase n=1 Tax=Gottfriedia sp. NPDC057948 TaxID=3346287 RepID=UPI0036DB2355